MKSLRSASLVLGSALLLLLPARAQELTESYRTALVAYKSGNFLEAGKAVEKAIKEQPLNARPLLLRGRIQTSLKKYPEAETDLRSALKVDHLSVLGYLFLGDLFYVQRKFTDARVQYSTYLHHEPKDPDVILQLIYCAVGDLDLGEAQRLTDTLDLFNEKSPAAYFARAALASSEKHDPDAHKFLQQVETMYGTTIYSQYLPNYLLIAKSL